ncbi:SdrD B-like domain-containing protein, partial [Allocoleopsis sp.]|uniref:SdrD B-like domain-containing protein n=1 Tax=Allocoleopsis sp. TaxID=3088169 RepID=UPI002FD3B04E
MADLFPNPLEFESLLPEENLSVKTDQLDYAPGSTATFTVTGVGEGETVQFDIVETVAGDDGVLNTYQPFTVTDGGTGDLDGLANGEIVTAWLVPADPDGDGPQVASALNATLQLTATALGADGAIGTADDRTAKTTFTDAEGSISKVYQHWADGDSQAADWNNNILSDQKSNYFEGEVIPHVFIYKASNNTPLTNGQSYSFNISYNYYNTSGNASGFDYITTYNISRQPTLVPGASGSTPTIDSTFANGGGTQGSFYTVDANITGVSNVTYSSPTGTRDGTVTVTFTYTGLTTTSGFAEIYYGLHIAQPGGAGPGTNGASAYPGGSLQTTVDIGGSGATSIQLAPGAIIAGQISGMKFNDLNGNGVQDTGEAGLAGWTIYLDNNNNGQLDTGEVSTVTDAQGKYSFSVTPDAIKSTTTNDPYYVREVNQTGWTQTSPTSGKYGPLLVTATTPQYLNQNFGNFKNIDISGYKWNDVNGNGVWDSGETGLQNWTIQLDKNNDGTIDATATTDSTGKYTFTNLGPGTYKVTELNQTGWTQTFGTSGYTFTATSGLNQTGTSGTATTYNFGNFQNNSNFSIDKQVGGVKNPDGTNDSDGKVDQVGDKINYNILVTNTGNTPLT